MRIKKMYRKISFVIVLIILIALLAIFSIPQLPVTTTTTISVTTMPVTTTLNQVTTTPATTESTTTLMNATLTTTVQTRKAISIMAYSCEKTTDIISLTIANRGNTIIGEDEIKVYINDEYVGTFGKSIEPGQSTKNTIQGVLGQNIVKVVSPSNYARIVLWCY